MDFALEDKKALVLGSSRGLGYATARQLSLEGVSVAINGRNAETLRLSAQTISGESKSSVFPIPGDATTQDDPQRIVYEATAALGGLDILVTNAGGPPAGSFESVTDAQWISAFNSCLMVHVRTIRAALPYLKRSPTPSILLITSVSIKQPMPNLILSNSVRAATGGLTKSLSFEFAPYGIRVNTIQPGLIDTERITELNTYQSQKSGLSIEEIRDNQAKSIPLGRIGSPEEFGKVAAFLVSPAASYITGAFVPVDGGSLKGW